MPATFKGPAVVWIHGGGFWAGDLDNPAVTPSTCTTLQTYACWLAANGVPVYDINYTLVNTVLTAKDMMISTSDNSTVRSASHTFTAADIGGAIIVVQGTGWTSAGYGIVAVDGNGAAILDGAPTLPANRFPAKYSLIKAGTMWPAQWQDTTCALSWAADNLGVNYPGDPGKLVLMGHSAGGHLVLATGLMPLGTFPSTCDSTNQQYAIQTIIALSPPSDLRTLYAESVPSQSDIRNLLGCIPGTRDCDTRATAASPTNYLALGQPHVIAISGQLDLGVPPINVSEIQLGYQALGSSCLWIVEPGEYHGLDVFYFTPCSSAPNGPEPTPCGSSGGVFKTILPLILAPPT